MTLEIALARKRKSEEILSRQNVPFIAHLPVVEDEESAQIRSLEEVAWRAMALCIVAGKGEGLEQARVLELIELYGLQDAFSPKERSFIFDPEPSDHEQLQFVWRYECYWILLWALHYVDELSSPDQMCDVPRAVQLMADRTAEEFVGNGELRNPSDILDETDLIYRYHWACVESQLKKTAIPKWLNCDVVVERHKALNWLVGYLDKADWDDVTTDT